MGQEQRNDFTLVERVGDEISTVAMRAPTGHAQPDSRGRIFRPMLCVMGLNQITACDASAACRHVKFPSYDTFRIILGSVEFRGAAEA